MHVFERVYICMGVFLESEYPYGCFFRGLTPIWVPRELELWTKCGLASR